MAHLRFRTTQTAAVMRVRDGMMREWHDWFEVSPALFLIFLQTPPPPHLLHSFSPDVSNSGGDLRGEAEGEA